MLIKLIYVILKFIKVKEFMSSSISIDLFDKAKLQQAFSYIEDDEWDKAKTIWILDFLKETPNLETKTFSTFNQSFDVFGRFLTSQQKYSETLECVNEKCKYSLGIKESDFYMFSRDDSNKLTHDFFFAKCRKCKTDVSCSLSGNFNINPAFLYCEMSYKNTTKPINCYELPKLLKINNLTFKLLLAQNVNKDKKPCIKTVKIVTSLKT
jgi:hypothetical protein